MALNGHATDLPAPPGNGEVPAESRENQGGAAPLPPAAPRKRGRRLARIANVKAGLGDVIRGIEAGSMQPKTGNALVYAYSVLAGVMSGSELEERIANLEAGAAEPKGNA